MNPVPDFVPVLSGGKHQALTEGACAMEMVAYLAGEPHSDHPACTNPVLAGLARNVNDYSDDAVRQRLAPLLPSLIGTNDGDRVVGVRLGVWCALEVVDLLEDEALLGLVLDAIYAAEAWCDDPSDELLEAAIISAGRVHSAPKASSRTAAQVVLAAADVADLFDLDGAALCAVRALSYAGREDELPDFLAGAIAEHQRLTGHKPPVADALDWAGLSEAMEGVR